MEAGGGAAEGRAPNSTYSRINNLGGSLVGREASKWLGTG